MTRFSEQDGVYFTESSLDHQVLGRLTVRAKTQNSTLFDVKKEMARQAIAMGGNGIIRFNYSQKADSALKNVFSFKWDTERLVATGDVVRFEKDPREQ